MQCAHCEYDFHEDDLYRGLCRFAFHDGDPSCRAYAESGTIEWPFPPEYSVNDIVMLKESAENCLPEYTEGSIHSITKVFSGGYYSLGNDQFIFSADELDLIL